MPYACEPRRTLNSTKNNHNMRNLKSELTGSSKRNVVVLQGVASNKSLLKVNKILLLAVLLLMTVIFLLGMLVFPENKLLANYQSNRPTEATANAISNSALTDEINLLRGQFVGLVSGSIESKLRSLEENIRAGRVNTSLNTVQDLKNDIKILKSYSVAGTTKGANNQLSDRVLNEVSQLKNLIYLTLISCGLIIAVIVGVWLKYNYRLAHKATAILEQYNKH